MKALVGFLCIVVIIGYGLFLTKRDRRSGKVQSHGRPLLDNLLLLVSGIVVAGAMALTLWWTEPATRSNTLGPVVFKLAFVAFAAGVTYIAYLLLRRKGGRKHKG
jgi:RsiW-degrading membrane proteinase PrsW (M82 family)